MSQENDAPEALPAEAKPKRERKPKAKAEERSEPAAEPEALPAEAKVEAEPPAAEAPPAEPPEPEPEPKAVRVTVGGLVVVEGRRLRLLEGDVYTGERARALRKACPERVAAEG